MFHFVGIYGIREVFCHNLLLISGKREDPQFREVHQSSTGHREEDPGDDQLDVRYCGAVAEEN